jgi:inositol-1,4,5-trisphosphate 5-phosphatase
MKDVRQLVRTIRDSDVLKEYDRMLALLDEDLETKETFTALGCLFFIHKSLGDVKLWNFKRKVFELISGNTVIGGNLEDSESHRKVKFPPDFFPEFKWSRKGFLQTKWSVCERIFNLVNVHLFHDASNTIAMTKSPSQYALNRKRALKHVTALVTKESGESVSTFYFGDFNFRLDLEKVVKHVCTDRNVETQLSRDSNGDICEAVYRLSQDEGSAEILRIEEKLFLYKFNSDFLSNGGRKFLEFDVEANQFTDLHELDRTFPPRFINFLKSV